MYLSCIKTYLYDLFAIIALYPNIYTGKVVLKRHIFCPDSGHNAVQYNNVGPHCVRAITAMAKKLSSGGLRHQ